MTPTDLDLDLDGGELEPSQDDLSSLWASGPSPELLGHALNTAPAVFSALSRDASLEGLEQAPALVTPLAEVRPGVTPCRLRRDLGEEPPPVSAELWAVGHELRRLSGPQGSRGG